jgi:2-polyprenyl-3-methyl-5-hydroxy-6-metoxy-1,4-benzoquinol methylase
MGFQQPSAPMKPFATIRLADAVLEDLQVPPPTLQTVPFPGELPRAERIRVELGDAPLSPELARSLATAGEGILPEKGLLLIDSRAPRDERRLAAFRDALWPSLHVFRAYRLQHERKVERIDADGSTILHNHFPAQWTGSTLAARRRAAALSPEATTTRFDRTASGWSGDPASPLYAHHRWMRRIVAELGAPGPGERALDAGCGAGWVGIEAAKLGAVVSALDPSAEMLKLLEQNATASGVKVDARLGFVEEAPFSEPFALVLNSGVLSYAPDAERYLDALDARVARGGRLVIGDLNPLSRGMARRRASRPVLPVREMNASTRDDVASRLEKRGYRIAARRFYQLTYPVPELMHWSASKLGGFGCSVLLRRNEKAASRDSDAASAFDSWLLRAEKPG